MSKFFGDDSSSDSSSSASEDEQPDRKQEAAGQKKRWADTSSSEEEETERRVVRSHKDKRYDDMKAKIKELKNRQKIEDFGAVTKDYEELFKMLGKLKAMKVHEDADGRPPNFFIKAIAALEDFLEKKHKEVQEKKAQGEKPMPENKAKAFNTLRAKVRKGNKEYQDVVKECIENPADFDSGDGSEDDEDEDSGSDSSSEQDGSSGDSSSSGSGSSSSSGSGSDSSSGSDSDSDSDSSSSGSSSGSDSSSSSEGQSASWRSGEDSSDEEELDEESRREKIMLRWLITDEKKKRNELKEQKLKDETSGKKKDKTKSVKDVKKKKDADQDKKLKKSEETEEYDEDKLSKKVKDIEARRGRRAFDKKAYMADLLELQVHAKGIGPRMELKILQTMVSADFDNTGSAFQAMKIDMWNDALNKVNQMLPLLIQSFDQMVTNNEKEVSEAEDQETTRSHPKIQAGFVDFVGKLDDELYKALQFTVDVYNADYQDILGNSSKFLVLLKRVFKFFEDTKQTQPLSMIALRLLEQLYYKPDILNSHVYDAIRNSTEFRIPEEEQDQWVWPKDSRAFIAKLCRYVFGSNQSKIKLRASLCQVYHLALHDHFQAARDLLQLRNLYDAAVEADVHEQILYNRVLAQLGLCAFRLGKIPDAHNCLMEVCMHNKARELLAQGLSFSKTLERTQEQERQERLRQLPYHMHINLDVLDSAHHICAMMLEVPNMAMQSMHPSLGRPVSKVLRRELERYERQVFNGPPETPKEAVVSAAKAVQCGDWAAACDALEDLKIWDHIDPGNDQAGAKVKAMIKEKIKTEALRTYLFSYASIYDAFQLDQLKEMFDLEPKQVHSIVSKMMIKEEITAFWDESSKFVLVQHSEPTPLQRFALTLADKCAQAVDANEKMLGQRTGQYGFADRDQHQQQGKGGWNQQQQGPQRRYGKGANVAPAMDEKGRKGKGRGKGFGNTGAARARGWENARAGASQRGGAQRGWATARLP